jgi:glycosyltransferase involved in cell wall biosynthesis
LSQTYSRLELVVLDNQSTDNTIPWLKSLQDSRIQIHSSSKPLSIVDSWARVKDVKKREYLTLIGHDDSFDPGFLEAIKGLIERHPDGALYQTGARLINSEGKTIRDCRPVPERETAAEYLKARFVSERDVFGTGYVMRSADYDLLGGIPAFEKLFFADDALWLSLIRNSYKFADRSVLFSVRIHPGSESASLPSAWSSLLFALDQFAEFIRGFKDGAPEVCSVSEAHEAEFMLGYHRNIYMLALIEACQNGRKVAPEVLTRIDSSLAGISPAVAGSLRRSPKVALIEMLNATPLRSMIPLLWNAYYRLKTRS